MSTAAAVLLREGGLVREINAHTQLLSNLVYQKCYLVSYLNSKKHMYKNSVRIVCFLCYVLAPLLLFFFPRCFMKVQFLQPSCWLGCSCVTAFPGAAGCSAPWTSGWRGASSKGHKVLLVRRSRLQLRWREALGSMKGSSPSSNSCCGTLLCSAAG